MKSGSHYLREIGEKQEERILDALVEAPISIYELGTRLDMQIPNLRRYLTRLMAGPIRHVHIEAFQRNQNGRPTPLYRFGNKPDAVFCPDKVRKPRQPNRTHANLRKAMEFLRSPRTAEEMGVEMCLSTSRARNYLRALRAEKKIHIKEWRHPGGRGDLAPVYWYGGRPDAPKPQETRAQRYAKDKADPEKYERILAKRRAADRVKAAKSTPNTWLSALGL